MFTEYRALQLPAQEGYLMQDRKLLTLSAETDSCCEAYKDSLTDSLLTRLG